MPTRRHLTRMSQPPQNPWGQPSSDGAGDQNPYGASSPYGQPEPYGQSEPYGQPAQPGQYGSGEPYGQPSAGSGWQSSASDAPSAPGFGQSSADGQGSSFTPAFGGAPQGGEPPKKGNGGKIALFVCIGCAVLALLLVLVGGGIFLFSNSGGGSDPTTEPATTSAQPTDEQTSDPVTEDASTDATTEEATTEDGTTEASGDKGTQENPYGTDEKFTLDDGAGGTFDVSFGATNWDNTKAVLDEYSGNEKPADGKVYVTVPVTVTYHGSDSAIAGLAMYPTFVSDNGSEYEQSSALGPDSDGYIKELKDGDSASYVQVFEVPKDQTGSGAYSVMSFGDFTADPVWVKAA